jgi:hypothetical protein
MVAVHVVAVEVIVDQPHRAPLTADVDLEHDGIVVDRATSAAKEDANALGEIDGDGIAIEVHGGSCLEERPSVSDERSRTVVFDGAARTRT